MAKKLVTASMSASGSEAPNYTSLLVDSPGLSYAVAEIVLQFQPKDLGGDNFYVVRSALGILAEFGRLDEALAYSIFERFVANKNYQEVERQGWLGVHRTAMDTLQRLGYRFSTKR